MLPATIKIPSFGVLWLGSAGFATIRQSFLFYYKFIGVSWKNARGGSGTVVGTTDWSSLDLPIAIGDNGIDLTAEDTAENLAMRFVMVFRSTF